MHSMLLLICGTKKQRAAARCPLRTVDVGGCWLAVDADLIDDDQRGFAVTAVDAFLADAAMADVGVARADLERRNGRVDKVERP